MIIEILGGLLLGILSAAALVVVVIFFGQLVQAGAALLPWIRRRLGLPQPLPPLPPALRVDLVAAAIAEAAGHNWAADMMPEYRAEFRRQARAAIAAHEAAR